MKREGFTQSDVTKALNAAKKANLDVAACTISLTGAIRLIFRDKDRREAEVLDEWDDVLQ